MTPEEIARNKNLQKMQDNKLPIPGRFNLQGMIEYLHKFSGRIPTENECMRFSMFLQSFQGKPTQEECEGFLRLLGMVRK